MPGEAGRRRRIAVLSVVVTVVAAACSNRPPAPIEERNRGGIARSEQRYTVLRGDTLYAIAFRNGLDYRRLAAANDIPVPYTIFPGQQLRLAEADLGRPPPAPAPSGAAPAAAADGAEPVARGAKTVPAPTPQPVRRAQATAKPPLASAAALPDPAVDAWRWPARGRVVRGFDGNLHKGIDLAGERGDPVTAAAPGRVVYAGSGIAGYGLMLILRHNDEYLSAYGHNESLLVVEGEAVRAGQTIARRGSTGTDGVKLHFEIRRRGRPVDPRGLLPRR